MILAEFRDTKKGVVATFPNESIVDRLHKRGSQLHSLMSMMTANDHISIMADEIQADLLWLATDISEEIKQMLESQQSERIKRFERERQAADLASVFTGVAAKSDLKSDLTAAAQPDTARSREREHA